MGNLSDRMGFKPFLVAGYVTCSVTGLLYYLAGSARLVFLGRVLQGAGEAPVWALAPALLPIRYGAAKGKVMGACNAVLHLGLTVGPLVGIAFADAWTGNQAFLSLSGRCPRGSSLSLVPACKFPPRSC